MHPGWSGALGGLLDAWQLKLNLEQMAAEAAALREERDAAMLRAEGAEAKLEEARTLAAKETAKARHLEERAGVMIGWVTAAEHRVEQESDAWHQASSSPPSLQ